MTGYQALIGIIDNDRVNDPGLEDGHKYFTMFGGYGLSTVTRSIFPYNAASPLFKSKQFAFRAGTQLIMELDMTVPTHGVASLAYLSNGVETVGTKNIACENIDVTKKYRLCVVLWSLNTKIALVDA